MRTDEYDIVNWTINKNLTNRDKDEKTPIISICAIIALSLTIGIILYYHPTYYKYNEYNDRFIIDNKVKYIIEEYGAFSVVRRNEAGKMFCGVYQIRDDAPELIMSHLFAL